MLKVVVGLGNPGDLYRNTRHNIGFDILDKISRIYNFDFKISKKFNAMISEFNILDNKFIFAKPQTFMNLSGKSVYKLINFFNLDIKNLLIIHDDVYIEMGKIKFKNLGNSGGHNGLNHIIQCLKDKKFSRIKIGVGFKPLEITLADFVLKKFTLEEKNIIDKVTDDMSKDFFLLLKSKQFL
jgi:PTH1 family peptidyl-tRNA hydrolase